jgi:hypothetical protein
MKINDKKPEFILSVEEMFAFAKLFSKETDVSFKEKEMSELEESYMGRVYANVQARYGSIEKRDKLISSYNPRGKEGE